MADANTPGPRPQLSVLGLMIWAGCFAAVFALVGWIDRVDRANLGAARVESPAYQAERWTGIAALNLLVLGVLVGEWLVTWGRNRRRHRQGLPPMSIWERWEWIAGPVLGVLTLGMVWLLGLLLVRGVRVVVFNDPPTYAALRGVLGLVLAVAFVIPCFNLVMIVLVWSMIPFLWAWHRLRGSKAGAEPPPARGPDDPRATAGDVG